MCLGESIDFYLSEEEIHALQIEQDSFAPTPSQIEAKSIEIIFQDESLMVINKPSAINVHPGDHKSQEVSVIEYIHDML